MNYKIKNKIEPVFSYNAVKQYCIQGGRLLNLCSNSFLNGVVNQSFIQSFGNDYFISTDSRGGDSCIVKIADLSIDKRFKIDACHFPFLTFYEFNGKSIEGVFNYEKDEIIFTTSNWLGRDILNEKIVSDYQNKIICRSIFSDNIIWSFPVETLGTYVNLSNETLPYEVKYFIGAWKNFLLVQMKNAMVLFLDIETGEQKHILHFKEHVMLPETVGLNDAPKMQLAGDELYWLSNQSLFKVTLQNFKVYNIRNYFNEPRELQYRFFYNTVLNGKIYFTAEKGWQTVVPHHLGVMDVGTGEVLWEYKPEKSHGLSEAPQFANGKLYMRTNNKELYVFEEDK